MTRFLPLLCLFILACATPLDKTANRRGRLLDEEAERVAGQSQIPTTTDTKTTPQVRVTPGRVGIDAQTGRRILSRSEINAIRKAGPGKILQFVEVAPAFWSSRFLGFRLKRIHTADARARPPHLMEGDVILRINKVRIKTPDDFFLVFQTLEKAQNIVFDIWRKEKRILVSYEIRDPEPAQTWSR